VLRHTPEAGYTMVRDAAGLDAGFKGAIDEGLITGLRLLVTISRRSAASGDLVSPSGASLDCCCVPRDPACRAASRRRSPTGRWYAAWCGLAPLRGSP
jgi:hypothetical protein